MPGSPRETSSPPLRILFLAILSATAASPSPSPPPPSAAIIASPITVYDWASSSCPSRQAMPPRACVPDILPGCDPDVVDACPRAWAAPRGAVARRMLGSVDLVSRAQTGPSLTSLQHDCNSPPYANSTRDGNDPNLAHFRGREWIESPVVGAGAVYALAHVDQVNRSGGYLYTAVTLFASADGGATFAPARAPPAHLVAASPYDNADGSLGPGVGWGMPSSLMRDAATGYYYVMLLANWGRSVGAQAGGLCLARTAAIADPGSWRGWAGPAAGFAAALDASPLLAPVPDPAAHACAPLRDAAGAVLAMRHLSLLWSTYFGRFLLFGEAQPGSATGPTGGWAFSLSDDLVHWDVPIAVATAGLISPNGTGAVAPISPMPGRFITVAGAPQEGSWWEAPGGEFKALVGACEPCPGLNACAGATVVSPAAFAALPNATFPFSCGLVYSASGVMDYAYAVLIDETAHVASGGVLDASFNNVGQEALLFLVAKTCAGAAYSRAAGAVVCSGLDARGADRRDVVRSVVRFGGPAPPFCQNGSYVDLRSVPADLAVPPMAPRGAPPAPGARVFASNPDWLRVVPASAAYHALYLPPEWAPAPAPPLPVIIELAGNGPFDDAYGDVSTGRCENSSLGFGVTGGAGAIWVSMPMLVAGGEFDGTQWWGCPPGPPAGDPPAVTSTACAAATTNASLAVAYIKSTTRHVLAAFNGDAARVVLAGFSRGAIGVNYLGLADDDIAALWAGSIAYAHYDGQPMDAHWPYPDAGPPASYERLRRLGARPTLIVSENDGATSDTEPYVRAAGFAVNATYLSTGFCNHNDKWALRPSPARDAMREWWRGVVGG